MNIIIIIIIIIIFSFIHIISAIQILGTSLAAHDILIFKSYSTLCIKSNMILPSSSSDESAVLTNNHSFPVMMDFRRSE